MSREESLFEAMGGTYRSVDGILYPNISFLQERMILETDDEGECLDIGKYGLIWISFMKEIHPDRYCHHIRMGELYIKAQEVNEEAYAMLDTIMNQYLAKHKPKDSNSTLENVENKRAGKDACGGGYLWRDCLQVSLMQERLQHKTKILCRPVIMPEKERII